LQHECEDGIVWSPQLSAMRRQQAFSSAFMTADGNMHAMSGVAPIRAIKARIPILAMRFIKLDHLKCTHSHP
jgi:hypothetical protein